MTASREPGESAQRRRVHARTADAPRATPVIGLDWGSSRLRAYRIDDTGRIADRRATSDGAVGLSGSEFDAVLARTVGDWARAEPRARLIACGMVGARGGWAEAPYVDLPAGVGTIGERVVQVPTSLGRPLSIVGGLRSAEPDVLRGEETQALGCQVSDGVLCMPGTHSKWLRIKAGVVESFATWFTGELFELLGSHGSLAKAFGASLPLEARSGADAAPPIDAAAFDAGVSHAGVSHAGVSHAGVSHAGNSQAADQQPGGQDWLHQLFLFRARVVGQGAAGGVERSRLSGWLLGCELRQALQRFPDAGQRAPILLVADPVLVGLYQRALAVVEAGRTRPRQFVSADADCAAHGLFRLGNGC